MWGIKQFFTQMHPTNFNHQQIRIKNLLHEKVYINRQLRHIMEALKGKVVVITGASEGIGAGVAIKLANNGMQVVALARRYEKLVDLQKQVTSNIGKIHPIKADVTQEEDVVKAFQWVEKEFGTAHVLINNAGIVIIKSVFDGTLEEWHKVVNSNFLSSCIASREFVQLFKRSSGTSGHIVNMSSMSGKLLAAPNLSAINLYAPTKAAMSGLGQVMRSDLVRKKLNIKVTNLHPGMVDTNMVPKIDGLPKIKVDDVADAVVYVLSTPPSVTITDMSIQANEELVL